MVEFKMETVGQDLRFAFAPVREKSVGDCNSGLCRCRRQYGRLSRLSTPRSIKPLLTPIPARGGVGQRKFTGISRNNISYPDYVDWKRLNHVFSSLDVFTGTGSLTRHPEPTVPGNAAFFKTLGIKPVLGRNFRSNEDAAGTAPVRDLS